MKKYIMGRQVIQRSLRWKIGNRENVQICNSFWIPRPVTFKIPSQPSLPTQATVACSTNEEHKWKGNLIIRTYT